MRIAKTVRTFIIAAGLLAAATAAHAQMSRAEVEKIVEEYIMTHGDVILRSVDDYQRKSMQARQQDAVAKNKEELYRDATAPFIGNEKGDVTIVEFFDYNCGFCKKVLPDIEKIADKDKNVKFIFKDLPILGPSSETAARFALAAQKQGKYFAFHKAAMEHKGGLDDATVEKIAKEAGLDVAKAKADAQSSEITLQIEKNRNLANMMGISGTPAFIIGEEIVPGAVPAAVIEQKVEALRKAKGGDKKAE